MPALSATSAVGCLPGATCRRADERFDARRSKRAPASLGARSLHSFMKWTATLPLLLGAFAGCDLFDKCTSRTEVILFGGHGPYLAYPLTLSVGEHYGYDLRNAYYLADQEGEGRHGCRQLNRRPLPVDRVVVFEPDVASVSVDAAYHEAQPRSAL